MPPTHFRSSRLLSRLSQSAVTRRRFLQTSAAVMSGVVLSNCARNLSNVNFSTDAATPPSPANSSDQKTLNIFAWANYVDDELIKGFKNATGIQVIVDTYDSNETMLAKVQAGGAKQYSIIYPSDYVVQQMIESGLLTPMEQARLSGTQNLMENWKDPIYDPENAHSLPAVWGTTGLTFDPDKMSSPVTGWDYVWDNVEQLSRQLTLISDVREVFGATLKYLGYSYNSTKPAEIKQAFEKLLKIKPAIASFVTNGWEDQLASGDLRLSMAYSQDAIALMDESPNLKYIVPETGTSLWTDTMVIPKSAPNPDAAYEWLNFMLEPSNAAQLVERLKISTPNAAAFNKLSDSLRNDENLFPSKAVLAKCESIAPVPQEIADLYDRYWTQLTST